MATCHKCGRAKIRKRPDGRRKCVKCGFLPTHHNLLVNGKAPVNPWGSCFDSAAHNLLANTDCDVTMCHGVGISTHPASAGKKIAHAWLEFDHEKYGRLAIDPIYLIAQRAEIYRKNLQAELVVTYSAREFIALWTKHDYPGPYDDRVKMHTKEVA